MGVPLGLVREYTRFAFGAGLWNFTGGNEAWYRCPWWNIRFYNLNWSFSEQTVVDSLFSILDPRFAQESRIAKLRRESRLATDCQLTFERKCHSLNGWFIMVIALSGVQFGLKSYAWFEITSMISDQNCTTRSSITTLLQPFWNSVSTKLLLIK